MADPGWLPIYMQRNLAVDWDGCWSWMRTRQQGYGATSYRGKRWLVHRFSYTMYVGPIPEGLVLDHLCRNRSCVNPDHLEPVTIPENIARGARAQQTHCHRGHEFTPENTLIYRITSEGGYSRRCRSCVRLRRVMKKELSND